MHLIIVAHKKDRAFPVPSSAAAVGGLREVARRIVSPVSRHARGPRPDRCVAHAHTNAGAVSEGVLSGDCPVDCCHTVSAFPLSVIQYLIFTLIVAMALSREVFLCFITRTGSTLAVDVYVVLPVLH